ncbi:MAG TPA: prolyl aminopeptidase [Actinopolymorphaceae bacterium]|jgi:proline iminopeptidase
MSDIRHPPVEPYEYGMLDVGEGHEIYWESCGNPAGHPAVFLHGGPGGGCSAHHRRLFDPHAYRAVLFDQRGCGRSRPLVSEPGPNLRTNTTERLVADIEKLRQHLSVHKWIVVGVSWGTTLGLAYAETHPDRVSGLVLGLVTTTSHREVQWMTYDLRRMYPREWERFATAVPESLRHLRLVDAYATLLADPDPAVHQPAADEWIAWDLTQSGTPPLKKHEDPAVRLTSARLVTHYWRHAAFLEDGRLARDAGLLDGIPGTLIGGAHDMSCPPDMAWELSRRWTTANLEIVDTGHGYSATNPHGFSRALVTAINQLRK